MNFPHTWHGNSHYGLLNWLHFHVHRVKGQGYMGPFMNKVWVLLLLRDLNNFHHTWHIYNSVTYWMIQCIPSFDKRTSYLYEHLLNINGVWNIPRLCALTYRNRLKCPVNALKNGQHLWWPWFDKGTILVGGESCRYSAAVYCSSSMSSLNCWTGI